MTSDQEAVCGTCGGSGHIEVGDSYGKCSHCNGTGRTPAPVVPSDERRQCWEVFSTTAIGASVIKWHCKLEKGHDGDHMGAQIHAAAPPTHSQDAEGNRRDTFWDGRGEWRRRAHHGRSTEWLYRHDDGTATALFVPDEVESAIRAPYEELVKAARDARSALVLLTSELSGQMGYIEGLQQRPHGQPQRTINYAHDVHAFLTATLTRIEESLGGRS